MAKKKVKRAQRVQVKDVSPKNYLTYTFLTAAVIVFASVFVFLAFDYFGMPSITGNVVEVGVEDQCNVFMGRMVHQIRDSDDCRLQCINACNMQDKDLKSSNFTVSEESCHECDCFCR
jgi:hypothetical protein